MKTAIVHLKSISPYSQSRYYSVPKQAKEPSAAYEDRTWRNRLNVDADGMVVIPPMALKNCLSEAAKLLGLRVPGKGRSTYAKHFLAGLLIADPIPLGIHRDKVASETLFVPSDGVRGGGKRVLKHFPVIPEWQGVANISIFDETIDANTLGLHLIQAGMFVGLGRFRPSSGGFYGRFAVTSLAVDGLPVDLEKLGD